MQLGVFLSFIKFKTGCIPREWLGWAGQAIVLSHIEMCSGSLSCMFCEQIGCHAQGPAEIVGHVKVEILGKFYFTI